MSKYSGSFDVYDYFMLHGGADDLSAVLERTKIYHGCELLNIKNEEELALYFPYIIWSASSSNGKNVIRISDTNYIRQSEKGVISIYSGLIIKEKLRLRRQGAGFSVQKISEKLFDRAYGDTARQYDELILLFKDTINPNTDGLRLRRFEPYRNTWFEDLTEIYGYDDDFARDWVWSLGEYERCINKLLLQEKT